jgi:hypothetical protein
MNIATDVADRAVALVQHFEAFNQGDSAPKARTPVARIADWLRACRLQAASKKPCGDVGSA